MYPTYSSRITALLENNPGHRAKIEQEIDQLLQKWENKANEEKPSSPKTADEFIAQLTKLSPDWTVEQFDEIIQFGKMKDEKKSYRSFIEMLMNQSEFEKYKKILELLFTSGDQQYKNEGLESKEICQRIVCFVSNFDDYPWICQHLGKYDNFRALAKRFKQII